MDHGSDVWLARASRRRGAGLNRGIGALVEAVAPGDDVLRGAVTAVKLHFGEEGNDAFLRPVHVSAVIAALKERGARPFLTDTNTLYRGSRRDSVDHFLTAQRHGFTLEGVGAPVIIAGGIRGTRAVRVPVAGKHFREVEIAPEFAEADVLVGLTHVKGHEMTGLGGALKNFGMGAASVGGKLAMHSGVSPEVRPPECTGCARCRRHCAHGAIVLAGGKASIDPSRCVGCGACIAVCPEGAIVFHWSAQAADLQEKMAEHAAGALAAYLPGRAFFLSFIMQVSPLCDCYPFAGPAIVPDVGVLASRDPVAIDQAAADLVNAQPGLAGSDLPEEFLPEGRDKFRGIHPNVDWAVQLVHAERLGLGRRAYRLVTVGE